MRPKPIKRPSYQLTDFRFNIRSYLSYSKLIILATTLLFLFAGSYYAFFVKPDHAATATVDIQVYKSVNNLKQEITLIKSPPVINQIRTVLNNRWVIVGLSLILGLLVSYVLVIAVD